MGWEIEGGKSEVKTVDRKNRPSQVKFSIKLKLKFEVGYLVFEKRSPVEAYVVQPDLRQRSGEVKRDFWGFYSHGHNLGR